ncbi:alpha/beta fold hydrolase [Microbacterium saccharophilum]|uniref:Alpha/beta fold hydrolase n=1 Tax=Microbacterium saccharophilum TaxID=1213358 RepID=A0A5C8HZF9_9MICO|nr:alpha/beta fold hydrolase [Microbacterium saccharophilum]TXK10760.1 alpha/beta fold hydrolase [Microbacterium saccharophilum]
MIHTDVVEAAAPPIRYARSGSDDVAWTERGTGAPLLLGGWWMSHLERDADYPPLRSFLATLESRRRVIRMDAPGSGLSRSRRETPAELGPHADALLAVLDAAGAPQVTLLAGSSGCPIAVAFAARHPDRVRRLILCGSYLHGDAIASAADRAALVDLVRRSWGVSSRVMAEIFYPDATPEEQRAFLQHQRATGTAAAAAAALAAVYSFDARDDAAAVSAPTLVLHRRGDRAIPLALGAETADAIPHARLEVLDGTAHHPWHGDSAAIIRHALAFDGDDAGDPAAAVDASPTASLLSPLTEREREILLLVARGMTDAQIADRLFLSIHTVHRHVANARAKLGAPSRAAAAAWVLARGM